MSAPILRRTLPACLAVVLALAARGGGDSAPDSAVTGETPAPSSTAAPTASPPSAKPTATAQTAAVVYTNSSGLWAAGLGGSAPRKLDDHQKFDGLTVSPDGRTVACNPKEAGLYVVGIDGSGKRLVDKDALGDPLFSPDGRTIATIGSDGPGLNVFVINIDGTGRQRLSDKGQFVAQIHPSGDYVLLAGVKDATKGLLGGAALDTVPIGGGPLTRIYSSDGSVHGMSWSPDGRRLALSLEAELSLDVKTDLYAMNADGTKLRRLTRTGDVFWPSWSPNGKQIAFSRSKQGVWLVGADGSGLRRVSASGTTPLFMPDGRIAFVDPRSGVRVVRADGSGAKTYGKGLVEYFALASKTG